MPGKVKVKIISGRNLPVMDRSSDTTDAYVEIKLGGTTYKTDVCRKSLHPHWNSDWYRFEVDDSELQDEPLQIRLMDHDTYSANDAIGKVYINLNPLLLPSMGPGNDGSAKKDNSSNSVMSGWFPVYDTMHGIRGEVNVVVKVELFSDFNRFRQSSCGIQFFCSKSIPHGYFAQTVHGFVEELIVNDDPEYQWIDKIRTPRASNEARQTLFFKLSGELQRKIGVKALDLGGNGVIGYCQCFDLEGESGIVARGIGTAVTLVKLIDTPSNITEINEERAQNYLKFLNHESGFRLNADPGVHNNPFSKPEFNLPSIDIENPRYRHLPRRYLNEQCFQQKIRCTKSNPCLSEQNPTLKTLLKQEEMRGTPSYGFGQKIKNFKYSSQNILSKKMTALKAKLGDSIGEEDDSDNCSIKSGQGEKRTRKFKKNESSVMAELLARSVLQVHDNLSSILETQDSGQIKDEILEPAESLKAVSSSSDSDDDDEDDRQDNVDFDTVSNIVKNVELMEQDYSNRKSKFSKQLSLPAISFEESEEEVSLPPSPSEVMAPLAEAESDEEFRTIIPSVEVTSDIKHEGLLRTAIQTILLERVTIVGTYTPPTSPTPGSPGSSSSVLNSTKNLPGKLQRCNTSLSLDDCKSHETVLGAPFVSMYNIRRQQSNPCLATSEDVQKRRFSFFRRKTVQPKSNLKKFKSDDLSRGRFSFFRRHRKTSENDEGGNKLTQIFHKPKNEYKESFKKHGLVGTALGNVVMETVQDILATSHSNKKKCPSFPSSSILTSTSVPVNTEIDRGTSDNNTHASLTPFPRENSAPIDNQEAAKIQSPAKLNSVPCIYRRSSDSELNITPKGNSLTGLNGHLHKPNVFLRSTVPQENFDMLEYPFLTMTKYPPGFILQLGGAVSARSVKLLERISNIEEPESRDIWWSEIRMEIRSHARALNCNAILGYSETTSICEDVCVLSASGTAAVIFFKYTGEMGESIVPLVPKNHGKEVMGSSLERHERDKIKSKTESPDHEIPRLACTICHLPYNTNNVPIRATILKCGSCRAGKVPEVLITTIETPESLPTVGLGCFIQSFVCRPLKDQKGESNAKEISDGLPFLEYELHRLLINKLKIKGMNAVFGLKIRISIGEKMLFGIATGTAVFLAPLLTPVLPKLVSDRSSDEKKLTDLQKLLLETVKKNREIYQLKNDDSFIGRILSDDDSEDEQTQIDLSLGNKDCCILEVDDPEDVEVVNMLMEDRPPDGFHVVNTEFVPGLDELDIVKNLQMFTQIYRSKFQPPYNFNVHFRRLLQSVYFKLRRMVPCALSDLQFRVDFPDNDEIQFCVLGMGLGLGDPQKIKTKRKPTGKRDDDLIFNLEDDNIPENSIANIRSRQKSPLRNRFVSIKHRHLPYKERHGVDLTPLSYVPGGRIEQYLGNLNFFFIRETTSIREEGGLSGFIHGFVTEVLAIVRAHVIALGGNAMVAYFMNECILNHSLHKNQGQCLINVGGDVVFVSYFREDS